jgi:hypothetical protein
MLTVTLPALLKMTRVVIFGSVSWVKPSNNAIETGVLLKLQTREGTRTAGNGIVRIRGNLPQRRSWQRRNALAMEGAK